MGSEAMVVRIKRALRRDLNPFANSDRRNTSGEMTTRLNRRVRTNREAPTIQDLDDDFIEEHHAITQLNRAATLMLVNHHAFPDEDVAAKMQIGMMDCRVRRNVALGLNTRQLKPAFVRRIANGCESSSHATEPAPTGLPQPEVDPNPVEPLPRAGSRSVILRGFGHG